MVAEDNGSYDVKPFGARVPEDVNLHPYQVEAIDTWQKNDFRGILTWRLVLERPIQV